MRMLTTHTHTHTHMYMHEHMQVLMLLLEEPTDATVEVAVAFTQRCGALLVEVSPQGLRAVLDRFRTVLQEGLCGRNAGSRIEGLMRDRKADFKRFPTVPAGLDLVEDEDRVTLDVSLDGALDTEPELDTYSYDEQYESHEEEWAEIKAEILGESDDDDDDEHDRDEDDEGGGGGGGGDADMHHGDAESVGEADTVNGMAVVTDDGPAAVPGKVGIVDMSDGDIVNLRRSLYLTIKSAASFEECVHKILRLQVHYPSLLPWMCLISRSSPH